MKILKIIQILLIISTISYAQHYGWDRKNFHVPDTLVSSYSTFSGYSSTSVLDINQAVDDIALRVYGYDDMSGNWLKLYLDSDGYGWAYSNRVFYIYAQDSIYLRAMTDDVIINSLTDDVILDPADDVIITMNDAAGASKFEIFDSGAASVFIINSNGEITTGQYKATSIADAYIDNAITVTPINATTETAIEAVCDLQSFQGAVTDGQVPADITINSTSTIQTSSVFNVGGSAGLSVTLNFDATSGKCSQMIFTGGILTAYTTVP